MRVIGYARLSRLIREESTSIARQRQIIRQTAEARGYELVEIVEDVDVSATSKRLHERPGIVEIRRRIAEGEADAVLVWRLDRLARSVGDISILLDEGLAIVSATESFDTTSPMGRAMVEIAQVFAAMEARTLGARVAASRGYLPTVGRYSGGPPPYGYRPAPNPDGPGRILEPDPAEAPIVRRIVDEILAGVPASRVARGLNADGVPTRNRASGRNPESEWRVTTVRQLVTGDALLGRVFSGGELVRDDRGIPVAPFEPLVTPEEHARLRATFRPHDDPEIGARISAGRKRASRMLSGVALCGACGRPLTARHPRKDPERNPPTYSCMARTRGQTCPKPVGVAALALETEIERRFLKTVGRFEVVERRTLAAENPELALIEEALRETTDALRDPDADVLALVDRLNALREERARAASAKPQTTISLVPTGVTYADVWARSDYLGRRATLLSAGAELYVDPIIRRAGPYFDPSRIRFRLGVDAAELTEEELDLLD